MVALKLNLGNLVMLNALSILEANQAPKPPGPGPAPVKPKI